MKNLELITFAAYAAGYIIESESSTGIWVYPKDAKPNAEGEFDCINWNPLTNNGDAFWLAVKLNFDIDTTAQGWISIRCYQYDLPFSSILLGDDPFAATRKAITVAAAEIGKFLKKQT